MAHVGEEARFRGSGLLSTQACGLELLLEFLALGDVTDRRDYLAWPAALWVAHQTAVGFEPAPAGIARHRQGTIGHDRAIEAAFGQLAIRCEDPRRIVGVESRQHAFAF